MKNSKWAMLYNPFTRVAGWKAFFIGAAIVCATVVLGWLSNTMAYGLEVKATDDYPLWKGFYFTWVGIACTVGVMYLAGIIFSKGVRFQDILGTVTLARAPYLLSPLLALTMPEGFLDDLNLAASTMDISLINWSGLILMGLLCIMISVWAVALLYNAFRVSTNLRGGKCAGIFIASLFISEVVMLCILW